MEAVKRRINICGVKNQVRSSFRMQIKRQKSGPGECEEYMGNWILCSDQNPWKRSNNIWLKSLYLRKTWFCTLKRFPKYRVKLLKIQTINVLSANVFIFTEIQENAQILRVWFNELWPTNGTENNSKTLVSSFVFLSS